MAQDDRTEKVEFVAQQAAYLRELAATAGLKTSIYLLSLVEADAKEMLKSSVAGRRPVRETV
jgi:hypothetical protein